MNVDTLPVGYRRNDAGLIVPEDISRKREVWTWQEWRDLERVTKRLVARGLAFQFKCQDPRCQDTKLERVRRPDGGITLRCNHLDREFHKGC